MENKQVTLTNTIKSRVGINVPELLLKRTWEKKGVKRTIDMNTLREAFYYPSVEYLLREGILYIDDMDVKIELGLEEPDTAAPTAIVILSENDMSRYNTRDINDILRSLPEWEASTSTKNFSIYGKQKYYRRKDSLL